MKLRIIESESTWYSDGLSFTCTQCGNCCTGAPGFVWISDVELKRLAAHLKISTHDVVELYGRRVGTRISLQERRNERGQHDCVFLKELPTKSGGVRRVCTIYPVRPLQCRTWPFWDGNLASKRNWKSAAKGCPGMNKGRSYTLEQIESLRTATDWPDDAPGSGKA
jgi:Fe-S-cluster containining protein